MKQTEEQKRADRLNYIFGGVKESRGYLKHGRDWLCCYCPQQTKTESKMIKHVKQWHDEPWKKSYGFYAESKMTPEAEEFYRTLHEIQSQCVRDGRRSDADWIEQFKMTRGIPYGHPISTDIPKRVRDLGAPKVHIKKPREYKGRDDYVIGKI